MPSSMPAGVSTAVRALVEGPVRPARVLGVFPTAVYLGTGDDGGSPLVAVLTSDALQLPCAAVLAVPSRMYDLRTVATPSARGLVGGGLVHLPGLSVHAGRWWVPRTPRPWPALPAISEPAHDAEHDAAHDAAHDATHDPELARALAAGSPARLGRLALSLLGRGEGLTPEGDDVLAAVLVAARALPRGHPVATSARGLAATVLGRAHRRTTSLSADLLAHAARGTGVPPLLDLVDAVGGRGDVAAALSTLRSVGHTSGDALARGTMTVARAASMVPPTSDRTRQRLEVA